MRIADNLDYSHSPIIFGTDITIRACIQDTNTSVMLSIFGRVGAIPLVVVNESTFPLSVPLSQFLVAVRFDSHQHKNMGIDGKNKCQFKWFSSSETSHIFRGDHELQC